MGGLDHSTMPAAYNDAIPSATTVRLPSIDFELLRAAAAELRRADDLLTSAAWQVPMGIEGVKPQDVGRAAGLAAAGEDALFLFCNIAANYCDLVGARAVLDTWRDDE